MTTLKTKCHFLYYKDLTPISHIDTLLKYRVDLKTFENFLYKMSLHNTPTNTGLFNADYILRVFFEKDLPKVKVVAEIYLDNIYVSTIEFDYDFIKMQTNNFVNQFDNKHFTLIKSKDLDKERT